MALAAALAAIPAFAVLKPVRWPHDGRRTSRRPATRGASGRSLGHDGFGRLGARFNAMLAALEESVRSPRRLVADASHELRTPSTSTRTNVFFVREGTAAAGRGEDMRSTRRPIELASAHHARLGSGRARSKRGAQAGRVKNVQLDDLVAGARWSVRRSAGSGGRRSSPPFSPLAPRVRADPVLLDGHVFLAGQRGQAAAPSATPIEVTVPEGEVVVADHWPRRGRRGRTAGSSTGSRARRPAIEARGRARAWGSTREAAPSTRAANMQRWRARAERRELPADFARDGVASCERSDASHATAIRDQSLPPPLCQQQHIQTDDLCNRGRFGLKPSCLCCRI